MSEAVLQSSSNDWSIGVS